MRIEIRKHSIDARKKPQLFDIYTVDADLGIGLSAEKKRIAKLRSKDISVVQPSEYSFPEAGSEKMEKRPVVIGAGPAGLFCTLMLAEHGYRPILLERGRRIEHRSSDIEKYWETGVLDPSSNIQFGEGGAGTFSDGKLNTQINDKTGRSAEVLRIFVSAGAPEDILYEGKPHIGTDKLRTVIPAIRERIIAAGGEVRFEAQVDGYSRSGSRAQRKGYNTRAVREGNSHAAERFCGGASRIPSPAADRPLPVWCL